ncbi:MAG: molybdopterin-dependent oxidoreductase, partial [Proteobacteria bacterium]|nr:molybdopterin-dependent oxidoreductase [Pseudomonadota bacterium]
MTNRREFMQGVGGLTLVIGSSGLITACSPEQAASIAQDSTTGEFTPNIWVTIGSDDTITIQFPATEMGQGSSTTLPVILADELDADWDNVVVETVAVDDPAYGNPVFGNMLYTAGSFTVHGYFAPLRRAG